MPSSTGGRYHVASVARPPTYEATAIAAVRADSTQPATTADRSTSISTALMKIGTSTMAITSAAPTTKLTTSAARHVAAAEHRALDERVI